MTDDAKRIVQQFADEFGGRFEEDEPADVFIDWEYWVETAVGQFMLIRFAEEYPNSQGKIIKQEPALIVRCTNYTKDEPVPVEYFMVIEDDPNSFQRDVFEETLSVDRPNKRLSFECESADETSDDRREVSIHFSDERQAFSVLENITAMG